ncbi:hypothetical protein GGF32_005744 [Allomyces javanicus]|nr:hypothetical protein GGF32_005744 [Allomyces javanicus]
MAVQPACRYLYFRDQWDEFDLQPFCHDAVTTLTFGEFRLTAALVLDMAAAFPATLSKLSLDVSGIAEDLALSIFYEHLPHTISTLQLDLDLHSQEVPADLGEASVLFTIVRRLIDTTVYSCFSAPSLTLDSHPLNLTPLTLKRCLPSRLLAKRTEESWTLPLTITHPIELCVLDLSQNKFHTVVTPLPDSLRVLNLASNPGLGDSLHPERWILSLPPHLRTLDVRACALDRDAGVLLMLVVERTVRRHGAQVRRLRVIAENNPMLDQMLEMLNRDY